MSSLKDLSFVSEEQEGEVRRWIRSSGRLEEDGEAEADDGMVVVVGERVKMSCAKATPLLLSEKSN